MEKFKKTLSLRRKKKDKTPEDDPNNKPLSWQEDEKKVREGCCSFQVKYLGFIEVFDSRGMQVCEEAIKALRRPKKKTIRAILYVSGDTIRVSDEISKGLIVDQTIEKVSFCSPDRNHKRGFAYICRDGTTRRWMCHAFLAVKETGERLSHAVGCAFAICLEKKQKRETDVIQPATMENRNLQKGGSFRQTSLTERLQDPQSVMIGDFPSSGPLHPLAICTASPNYSRAAVIPRPHASASFFTERQTSNRMFPKLQESSPFKRELSLRLAELPGSSPTSRRTECSHVDLETQLLPAMVQDNLLDTSNYPIDHTLYSYAINKVVGKFIEGEITYSKAIFLRLKCYYMHSEKPVMKAKRMHLYKSGATVGK